MEEAESQAQRAGEDSGPARTMHAGYCRFSAKLITTALFLCLLWSSSIDLKNTCAFKLL